MVLFGSFVNGIAIVIGAVVGSLFAKRLDDSFADKSDIAMGLCILVISLNGIIGEYRAINLIVSMAIGMLIGEFIDLDNMIVKLGHKIEKAMKTNSPLSKGFISASLVFCVGGMAVYGALESGILNQHDTLILKGLIDGIMSIFMAASLGIGVALSGILVFIYQGLMALFATFLEPYLTDFVINQMLIVGNLLLTAVGLNLCKIAKIKTMNLVPAIFVSIILSLFGI